MSREPSSIEKAVRAEMGERGEHLAGAQATPKQLDLIAEQHGGKLPSNVFRLLRESEAEGERGRGRPKGSRNKRNDDLAKLIEHRGGNPVLAMVDMYATPFDQQIQLIYAAEGIAEREERLMRVVDETMELISEARAAVRKMLRGESLILEPEKLIKLLEKISDMTERVVDMAKGLKSKPGELAIKVLNLRLAAAKAVAEYHSSKKPVEANVNHNLDGVLIMAGAAARAQTADARAELYERTGREIGEMLKSGAIEPRQLEGYRLDEDSGELVEAEYRDLGAEDESE